MKINPEPGRMYLEQAFPEARMPTQGNPGDPKRIVMKVVRLGEGIENFELGEKVLLENSPTVCHLPRGCVCTPQDVIGRVVESDGEDEVAFRKAPQIVAVSPQDAAKMAKGQVRLDG